VRLDAINGEAGLVEVGDILIDRLRSPALAAGTCRVLWQVPGLSHPYGYDRCRA
jgi:hypothetical protein